jgi:rhodanese-related sulfurtransferase
MLQLVLAITFYTSIFFPFQEVVEVIDANKLKSVRKSDVYLVDVRTPNEYINGRIPGAVNIDFLNEKFASSFEEYDKTKPIVIYCAVGGRSERASEMLKGLGFEKIYDYKGGFVDWQKRGETIER